MYVAALAAALDPASAPLPFRVGTEINITTVALVLMGIASFWWGVVRQGDRVNQNSTRLDALDKKIADLTARDEELAREFKAKIEELWRELLKKHDDLLTAITAHASAFGIYQIAATQDFINKTDFRDAMKDSQAQRMELKADLLKALETAEKRLTASINLHLAKGQGDD